MNQIAGSAFKVGEGLESCTSKVQLARCIINNELVTLVDTPGFDDTYKSRCEILKDIADFLAQAHMQGALLCGIIYLYRISDNRFGGLAVENMAMFKKICGKTAMSNVVIATTMWGELDAAPDRRRREVLREQELQTNSVFFKAAFDEGAQSLRLSGDRSSAMEAINFLINKDPVVLEMQRELVEGRKTLRQTAVGKKLYSILKETLEWFSQKLKQDQDQLRKAQKTPGNLTSQDRSNLEESIGEGEERVRRLREDMEVISRSGQWIRRWMECRREVLNAIIIRRMWGGGGGCFGAEDIEL